jgi:hypothetical protein
VIDDEKGLSTLVCGDVGNDSPSQCNHRVPEANANVARAGPDDGNGKVYHEIDEDMLLINLEGESLLGFQLNSSNDKEYEALIKVEPDTDHNATSYSIGPSASNNGVLPNDDDQDSIDE